MERWLVIAMLCAVGLPAVAQVAVRELDRDIILQRLDISATSTADRQALLKHAFEPAGCRGDRLREQPVKYSRIGNVVCILPGAGNRVIIVGAHFDCVDDGSGIADNWSGAALLPSLYESLASRPRNHTFIFVGFTEEELGMRGSDAYAGSMSKQERARASAMLNLDTLGLATTSVWLSHADDKLVKHILKVARAMNLPLTAVNFEKVGATDSEPFERRNIPSLTLHSVTQENYHILHSPQDRLASIHPNDYYDSYRLAAVFLAYLDGALDAAPQELPQK